MSRNKPASTRKAAAADPVLELAYDLDRLPSSQHRAGLAGLLLMCEWRERQLEGSGQPHGICDLVLHGPRTATLRIDRRGLESLFDHVYAADPVERSYPRPFKNKEPDAQREIEELHPKTQKPVKKTVYIYNAAVPRGAFLADWDPTRDSGGVWLKLWRDMIWSIMRGVPATRAPFEARAAGQPDKLAETVFAQLSRCDAAVDLPSTYYLGAQSRTAENVAFYDTAGNQLLLHFWPFVAPIYVPATLDSDGKRGFRGYAVAVPDVADLPRFCQELEYVMRHRTGELAAYVPRDAVVDLLVESALDLLFRLTERVSERAGNLADLVYGIDVFHVDKEGNSIRMLGTARLDLELGMQSEYEIVRKAGYRNHLARRQLLVNVVERRPWYAGFERLLATTSSALTIESTWFCNDIKTAFRIAFRNHEDSMSENPSDPQPAQERSLELLIYRIVGNYLAYKLDSKHELKWDQIKDLPETDPRRRDYGEKRRAIARGAFLAVRSRTNKADFIDYFTGTLFSVSQKLSAGDYEHISRELMKDDSPVRTLTLLALGARA